MITTRTCQRTLTLRSFVTVTAVIKRNNYDFFLEDMNNCLKYVGKWFNSDCLQTTSKVFHGHFGEEIMSRHDNVSLFVDRSRDFKRSNHAAIYFYSTELG